MENKIKLMSQEESRINQLIENIQKIVRVDSVRNLDDATDDSKFGSGTGKALDVYLELAKEIGMRTYRDDQGYYGYAEVGPESATEMIAVLGHVDVVPVGDLKQWTMAQPFSGDIVDECIVARGSLDDKGPMVVNLMAVKNLLDLNVKLTKRIRIIIGTAEETTWECIAKYNEKEEKPTIAYSPDANFPLISAEKTIQQFDGIKKDVNNSFTLIANGAYNAVNDKVTYSGSKEEELAKQLDKLAYKYEKDENGITVSGKSAHSMACYLGENAIYKIVEAMYQIGERSQTIDFIYNKLLHTYHAELMCGDIQDEVSGKLTLNVGWIKIEKDQEAIGFDTRIPVLVDEDEIIATYKKELEANGLEINLQKKSDKLYKSEDSLLVSTLLSAYKEVTGEMDAKPLSSGGGTYARAVHNTVAFGMVFSKHKMIDLMHQPNERLEIKFLAPALEIYTLALYKLLESK